MEPDGCGLVNSWRLEMGILEDRLYFRIFLDLQAAESVRHCLAKTDDRVFAITQQLICIGDLTKNISTIR
jgi:hypothetical protein